MLQKRRGGWMGRLKCMRQLPEYRLSLTKEWNIEEII